MTDDRAEPRSERRSDLAPRIALALAVTYGALHAIAAGLATHATWSWRALEDGALDKSWQLQLAWRAMEGEWVGRDFHYTMGPLWQLLAWIGTAPSWGAADGFDAGWAMAGMVVVFRLAALGVGLWLVLRWVQPGWARVVCFVAVVALSNGAGLATLRAFVSTAIIVSYGARALEREDASWRDAFGTAAWIVAGLALSFDRFALGVISVAVMATAELTSRWRRGEAKRPALLRPLQTGAATLALLLGLALSMLLLGADPLRYVIAQRTLTQAYGANLSTGWLAAIPAINVASLVAIAALVAGLRLIRSGGTRTAIWIAGALPLSAFGIVLSDAGHVFVAVSPLALTLLLAAARTETGRVGLYRPSAGLLAACFLLGWFAVHPDTLGLRPRTFAEALREPDPADLAYVTDRRRAVERVRALRETEAVPCLGVSASISVVHALAGVGGPTEMAVRWNDTLQRELADGLAREQCPFFVYEQYTFDVPDGVWWLGEDTLAVARHYERLEDVGPALSLLRWRDTPAAIPERRLPVPDAARALSVPGELVIPLGRSVPGTHLVRLTYLLEMDGLRAQLGGAPLLEQRFEREGEPLGDWQWMHHVQVGAPSVAYLTPDPEAAELRWIRGAPVRRDRRADAIRIRARSRGRLSPDAIDLRLLEVAELSPPPATPRLPPACDRERDLLPALEAGVASARYTTPRMVGDSFQLFSNPPDHDPAEVYFPIAPCADTCFEAELSMHGDGDEGDGVDVELNVLEDEHRPRVASVHVPPGGLERLQVRLDAWAGHAASMRIGVTPGESADADYLYVHTPRLGPCSAPVDLVAAHREGRTEVHGGHARIRNDAIVLPPSDTELAYRVYIDADLCASLTLALDGVGETDFHVDVKVDGLRTRVDEGRLGPNGTRHVIRGHSLHDWYGRWVELVIGVQPVLGRPRVRVEAPRLHRCGES